MWVPTSRHLRGGESPGSEPKRPAFIADLYESKVRAMREEYRSATEAESERWKAAERLARLVMERLTDSLDCASGAWIGPEMREKMQSEAKRVLGEKP